MASRKVKPITKADLARLKGCTRQAVQKQVNGALRVALLPDGLVDSAHPAVVDWLREPKREQRTKHKPNWRPIRELQEMLGVDDAEMLRLLATLPPEAVRLPEGIK